MRWDVNKLADWVASRHRLVVITGAGISTDSGIPDYRDSNGEWKRRKPIDYQTFTGSLATQKRYWARSAVGWKAFSRARPNTSHFRLAALEKDGFCTTTITQNVDGLHQKAGSRHVIDLHGRLDTVRCLACSWYGDRGSFQRRLLALNSAWAAWREATVAPDGDADLEADFSEFRVPRCPICLGTLKPDVVFFGEAIPRERTKRTLDAVYRADGILIVGSSLMVWSGYRLVRLAFERGISTVAINMGRTRADSLLTTKLTAACGSILDQLTARLCSSEPPSPSN